MDDMPSVQFATTSDGVRIALSVTGEGPPLVYVNGWVSHLELDWGRPDIRAFYQRISAGHRLVRFDGRGSGLSDRGVSDLSHRARARDLEAVVDHLQLEPFVMFAWSNATPPAVVYAAEHPERLTHLILSSPFCGGHGRGDREQVTRALLELIRAEWGVGARTTMGFVHPDASLEEQQASLRYLRASSTGDVAAAILEDSMFHVDICDLLPSVTAPTLVLHRRNDGAVPLEFGRQVASRLPNARFVPLDGDHHLPFEGDTEPVIRAINEFLGVEHVSPPAADATGEAPVTLMITDIEDSTTMTERLGDAAAQDLIRIHNQVVRDAVRANGGTEVKHTGDGIMASFPSASRAVEAAVQVQRALAEHNRALPESALHVRIGLNAGEPVREGDDFFGQTVQTASRIAARARPDRILVSDVVRTLAAGKGFQFTYRGRSQLRGLSRRVRLYDVGWEPN